MNELNRAAAVLCLSGLVLTGCVSAPIPLAGKTYEQRSVSVDRYMIGGQPSDKDIERLKEKGLKRIINFRTEEEMNDRKEVGFDEADVARQLGLEYTIIPVGGTKHPYSTKTLSALEEALKLDNSPILLHCSSGSRAGMVWAAYAVKHLGKTPDEALKTLEPVGLWPLGLEKLLAVPLSVQFKNKPAAS